jgi:integrase
LVLGFFCGIRPIGELRKVRCGDVSIAEKEVVIRSEVAKTRRKRVIKLSDSAIAWLAERRPNSLAVFRTISTSTTPFGVACSSS